MPEKQDFFTISNGRVKMNNLGGYKTTADALLLAEHTSAKDNQTVLDAGIGAGGISLTLLDKNPLLKITGIDTSRAMLADAKKNAELNGRNIELIYADILNWKTDRLFDCVVTNPPYFSGTPREDNAHHNVNVYEWIIACAKRLRSRGTIHVIISTDVMDAVMAALYNTKCRGMRISPLATINGIKRVIISARLNVKTPAQIYFPIDFNKV